MLSFLLLLCCTPAVYPHYYSPPPWRSSTPTITYHYRWTPRSHYARRLPPPPPPPRYHTHSVPPWEETIMRHQKIMDGNGTHFFFSQFTETPSNSFSSGRRQNETKIKVMGQVATKVLGKILSGGGSDKEKKQESSVTLGDVVFVSARIPEEVTILPARINSSTHLKMTPQEQNNVFTAAADSSLIVMRGGKRLRKVKKRKPKERIVRE